MPQGQLQINTDEEATVLKRWRDFTHKKKVQKFPGFIRVFPLRCRSVWCKDCARTSPTNAVISDRLRQLDFTKVRHLILTVNRTYSPDLAFEKLSTSKAIWNTINTLKCGLNPDKSGLNPGFRYLWVLEFHTDGYPHWHVVLEGQNSGKSGMIGKKNLDRAWFYGLTWESYIKSKEHWERIIGYHQKSGYLGGTSENKRHQLELPEYLKGKTHVRKFGANFSSLSNLQALLNDSNNQSNNEPETLCKLKRTRNRAPATPYGKRKCGNESYVEINIAGKTLHTTKMTISLPASDVTDTILCLAPESKESDYEFLCSRQTAIELYTRLSTFESKLIKPKAIREAPVQAVRHVHSQAEALSSLALS